MAVPVAWLLVTRTVVAPPAGAVGHGPWCHRSSPWRWCGWWRAIAVSPVVTVAVVPPVAGNRGVTGRDRDHSAAARGGANRGGSTRRRLTRRWNGSGRRRRT